MAAKALCTIVKAINDPLLLGAWVRDAKSWFAWIAFIKTLFDLPLRRDEQAVFRTCTNRTYKSRSYDRAFLVCGRRGGKSAALALVGVFLACFFDWRPYLKPGEEGTIMIIAASRKQARVIFNYMVGMLRASPMLKTMIVGKPNSSRTTLNNGVVIEIHTASWRSTRSFTCVAALLDEAAFWRDENSANPDEEIINALEPAMASIPGSMMLCASSPYARSGIVYKTFKESFGVDDADDLVWRAPTQIMNPTIPQKVIDKAYRKDPVKAATEYGAEFRLDLQSLISDEALDAVTDDGVRERAPQGRSEVEQYYAFIDPSGGSQDSMTLAIAHVDHANERAVLDLVREVQPPFSPKRVVKEFSEVMKRYRCLSARGDRYGGIWPVEAFAQHGISYEASEETKSEIYLESVALINASQCLLLDHSIMRNQMTSLQRRAGKTGKDAVDHPPFIHDDVANAACGAIVLASRNLVIVDYDDTTIGASSEYQPGGPAAVSPLQAYLETGNVTDQDF